jgi:hypothetical protein
MLIRINSTVTVGSLVLALAAGITQAPALAQTAPSVAATVAGAAETPDVAQAGVYADVPVGHWAYDAVAQLAQEGYIKGYPDGTFKGARPMTRYEVAALVARADTAIRQAIASGQQVKPSDIAALKALLTEFGSEVKDIQNRVAALETKTNNLQTQANNLQTQANATQVEARASRLAIQGAHINDSMLFRPGTTETNFQVLNGPSTTAGAAPFTYLTATGAVAGTRGTAYSFGPGALNSIVPGVTGNGTLFWFDRVGLNGQIDHGWSYGARITTGGIHQENPNGTTTGTGFCTGLSITNCTYDNLNGTQGTIPIVLDFAFTQWTSPGGVYALVGKYGVTEGNFLVYDIGQLFAGQVIAGASAGYRSPDGNLQAQFIYGWSGVSGATLAGVNNNTAPGAAAVNSVCANNVVGLNRGNTVGGYSNFNPNCNETNNEFGTQISYRVPQTRTVIDVAEDYFTQKTDPLWDPAAVSCTVPAAPGLVAGTFTAVNPQACGNNAGHVNTLAGGAGNYLTGQTNIGMWEVAAAQYLGNKVKPQFQIGASYVQRFGYDPFTGRAWQGGSDFLAQLTYASKGNLTFITPGAFLPNPGTRNSNVAQLSFAQYGLNSFFGIDAGPIGVVTPTSNLGLSSFNGMQVYMVQYAHWFTDNVRVGLIGIHVQNIPGVGLPIGAAGTGGLNPCPGCSGALQENQVNLETFLTM